jgi:hypothetical protein
LRGLQRALGSGDVECGVVGNCRWSGAPHNGQGWPGCSWRRGLRGS